MVMIEFDFDCGKEFGMDDVLVRGIVGNVIRIFG